jgi:hypothetical protein
MTQQWLANYCYDESIRKYETKKRVMASYGLNIIVLSMVPNFLFSWVNLCNVNMARTFNMQGWKICSTYFAYAMGWYICDNHSILVLVTVIFLM